MNPLVSVVMPAYNAEKFVGEAITSILHQTYRNLELIIVEDCSIDNTLKEIEKFHDERIKLLRNPVNKGIAYSTNRGIEVSRGKYIALMDDDDISEPDRIKLQVDFLEERQSIDILGGRYCEINENGDILQYHNIPRNNPKTRNRLLQNGGACLMSHSKVKKLFFLFIKFFLCDDTGIEQIFIF